MKKLFIVLAVASLGFAACNNDSTSEADQKRIDDSIAAKKTEDSLSAEKMKMDAEAAQKKMDDSLAAKKIQDSIDAAKKGKK
jgi:hypothetical protein